MSDLPEYVLERNFNAPREMVWRAWTDPDLLSRWYGPNVETIIHGFELKPGGAWLNEMKMRGSSFFSKMLFQEVETEALLVWHHYSSTDADWNPVASPMMADWPVNLLTTVNFRDVNGKTAVRLSQIPVDASAAEISCFAEKMAFMDQGWGSGYTILDEMLEELQAKGA